MAYIIGTPFDDKGFSWSFPGDRPSPPPPNPPAIKGTDEDDYIDALEGNDLVFAKGGNDYVDGWTGNDYLGGEYGNDTLLGWEGDDTLYGEFGDDLLNGEADNDFLWGGGGTDTLIGGSGADEFYFYSPGEGIDIIQDFNFLEGDKIAVTTHASVNFVFGPLGSGDYDRFQYDSGTGALSFNGTNFAQLEPNLDFVSSRDIVFGSLIE
jgi:Ca2+-binding RTX toxin-like protein